MPPHVAEVIRHLPPELKRRIKAALHALSRDPALGEPLERELEGLWKYLVRRFRIVYAIDRAARRVKIFAVGHRRTIYEAAAAMPARPRRSTRGLRDGLSTRGMPVGRPQATGTSLHTPGGGGERSARQPADQPWDVGRDAVDLLDLLWAAGSARSLVVSTLPAASVGPPAALRRVGAGPPGCAAPR